MLLAWYGRKLSAHKMATLGVGVILSSHIVMVTMILIVTYIWKKKFYIMKTHVRGFFDTDLHEVSWHFATHEAVRPSGF